ncbi:MULTISPECIES: C39 family peptidase [Streptomyces]|uniref:C39 family peptidase n=2 Tax=Streptomyces TaxID=1883 RepID=A0ABV9IXS8_9ACTN
MPPPCCTETSPPSSFHEPVGIVTQYATADLIGGIAYEGHDPGADPAWKTTGAPSQHIYARWCRHMCGVACLRMVLLHHKGYAPNLFALLQGARHHGAYVRTGNDIKGLIYAPFVDYVQQTHDLDAAVQGNLDMDGLLALLGTGHMVMTSVSKEIRKPEADPERKGGHLVLAIGYRDGRIHFRNPSGHTPESRAAALPPDRFDAFFGGRGISLDPRRSVRRRHALVTTTSPVASRPTT